MLKICDEKSSQQLIKSVAVIYKNLFVLKHAQMGLTFILKSVMVEVKSKLFQTLVIRLIRIYDCDTNTHTPTHTHTHTPAHTHTQYLF